MRWVAAGIWGVGSYEQKGRHIGGLGAGNMTKANTCSSQELSCFDACFLLSLHLAILGAFILWCFSAFFSRPTVTRSSGGS